MKHAIAELKALLDTWGPQKSEDWNKDIKVAIRSLEYRGGFGDEHHRSDMAQTNVEEANAGVVPTAAEFIDSRSNLGVVLGVGPGGIDDDLGELDPSAACDLSKEGGCESCQ